MRERYSSELKWYEKMLGIWRINRDSIDTEWGYLSPRFGLELVLHRGGYFNPHYAIAFCFLWGKFYIKLPFKTSLGEGCDLPRYGFIIFGNTLMMYWGGKFDKSIGQTNSRLKCWDLPFVSYVFDYHKVVNKQGTWEDGTASYDNQNIDRQSYPYTYVLKSGEIQHRTATCFVEERQWHRKWFPWVKLTQKSLSIEFSDEVGERSGSWKGGTIGCNYDILENETIEDCLSRMSKERVFN